MSVVQNDMVDLGKRSGLKINRVSVGSMRLPKDDEAAVKLVQQAIDAGMIYIDTCRGYGRTELQVAKSVKEGEMFSEGFSTNLPLDFREAWLVGEETGNLDEVTKRLADSYAANAEFIFTQLATWLPRIVYFIVCIKIALDVVKGYTNLYSNF